jgi:hypothetical protein
MIVPRGRSCSPVTKLFDALCSLLLAISALTAIIADLSITTQAAEPATMTLACKGTEATSGILEDEPHRQAVGIDHCMYLAG